MAVAGWHWKSVAGKSSIASRQRASAAESQPKGSADIPVRFFPLDHAQADKNVRAPGKSSQDTTILGDSAADPEAITGNVNFNWE